MQLNELSPPKGAVKKKKRLGRGESSGLGKTSGKGHKGQKARSGGYHKVGFEGGQMPLQRRLPKVGFRPRNRVRYATVNLLDLVKYEAGTKIDLDFLKSEGKIKKSLAGLKILGDGELDKSLIITAAKFTKSAKEKIEKAGGQAIEMAVEKKEENN